FPGTCGKPRCAQRRVTMVGTSVMATCSVMAGSCSGRSRRHLRLLGAVGGRRRPQCAGMTKARLDVRDGPSRWWSRGESNPCPDRSTAVFSERSPGMGCRRRGWPRDGRLVRSCPSSCPAAIGQRLAGGEGSGGRRRSQLEPVAGASGSGGECPIGLLGVGSYRWSEWIYEGIRPSLGSLFSCRTSTRRNQGGPVGEKDLSLSNSLVGGGLVARCERAVRCR